MVRFFFLAVAVAAAGSIAMKITNVRTTVLKGTDPAGMDGTPRTWHTIIVRIDTDEDLYGLGEAPHWQRDTFGVRDTIHHLGRRITGQSPFDIRRIVTEHLHGARPPHKPRSLPGTIVPVGPFVWAMSGIEMALCDLVGKALGTPVYNLFGGKYRDRVPVYLDRPGPRRPDDLGEWKAVASKARDEGFRHLKFDIDKSAPELTRDVWSRTLPIDQINAIVKRLGAVREAVGPDTEIAVDAHMHYDVNSAIRLGRELAPLKLAWFEDPTPVLNHDAVAEIRRMVDIPICVGEMFTPEQARIFIDDDACDIIHPDVLFAGGLHEARKIADYVELHHIPLAFHMNSTALGATASAHLAANIANCIGIEYHFWDAPWTMQLVDRGVPFIEHGHVPLTDRPGLGCELNEDVCRECLAEGEELF